MNSQLRQQLINKWPQIAPDARPMNPALNTTVQAILDAERIEAGLADDSLLNRVLFDPAWCPTMHGKLMAELEELHASEHEGGNAVYETFRGETYDPHDPTSTSGTALLKFPGDRRLFVCRNNADRLTAILRNQGPWRYCDVCIAENCQACTFNDHSTRPLPISCGRVVLMFEICMACEFVVTDTAFYGLRSSVMDAARPPAHGGDVVADQQRSLHPGSEVARAQQLRADVNHLRRLHPRAGDREPVAGTCCSGDEYERDQHVWVTGRRSSPENWPAETAAFDGAAPDSLSEVVFGRHATAGHRRAQRFVVAFVLVGIRLRETGQRPIRRVAFTEVGRDSRPGPTPRSGSTVDVVFDLLYRIGRQSADDGCTGARVQRRDRVLDLLGGQVDGRFLLA